MGEDEESLSILRKLSSAEPENLEWKFKIARLLNGLGKISEARDAFEDILARKLLSFEALFANTMMLDKLGDREAVLRRLEEALMVAQNENKVKEAREVKLMIAQMKFLYKDVDGALRVYEELLKVDQFDYTPFFCKEFMISLIEKNVEFMERFVEFPRFSPKKYDVEVFMTVLLSRMKSLDGELIEF